MGIHPSDVLRLIDTRCDSHRGHYVNQMADALMQATGRQYRRGGVVLRQAVFWGSGSDSTCAGRLRGASQRGPTPRRHSTCSPVDTAAVWIPSNRLAERARLDVALAASAMPAYDDPNPPHGPERRAHPRDRTPGPLEAGRRHGRPLHPRRIRRVGAAVSVDNVLNDFCLRAVPPTSA